jgi:hypothetical protein
MTIDKFCPCCGTVQPAAISRVDDALGCHEWRCSECSGTCVVKLDQPGKLFAFWPADIDRALDSSEKPYTAPF